MKHLMMLRTWGVWLLGAAFCFSFAGCKESEGLKMSRLEEQLEQNAKLGVRAVEFPKGLDWFNVSRALVLSDLKGKVTLLDFWTYCCINCMHVLPELARLETKYPNELVVVGVHSAKFSNERDSENIRQSVLRYEVKHPVVNDPPLTLWQTYGVHAWPTLVLIDPLGRVVLSVSGEGHYDLLDDAVGILIRKHASSINRALLPIDLESNRLERGSLLFPGKIFADSDGLVISDSNHNQVLISDLTGTVREVIGDGQAGSKDGNFHSAEFNRPQGIFRSGNFIYVADTENHLIREIDLAKKTVRTIAGTGIMGSFLHGKARALETALNSPWDLTKVGNTLYVAMAGAHQIWKLDLKSGMIELFAGSGREDIIDGAASSSALAQPSGITFDGKEYLYFADSEVSAVRRIHLKTRQVETLIGSGLFDFGDEDGDLKSAELQHPLGVSYSNGVVYVADTYNDKIKAIYLAEKKIETVAGNGKGKLQDAPPGALYEPGGLNVYAGKVFIADTNNHAVRVLDLETKKLSTLVIMRTQRTISDVGARFIAPIGSALQSSGVINVAPTSGSPRQNPFLQTVEYSREILSKNAQISISVALPPNHEFTENLSLDYKIKWREGAREKDVKSGSLTEPAKELPIRFPLDSTSLLSLLPEGEGGAAEGEPRQGRGEGDMLVELNVNYCTTVQPKLCKFKTLQITQPIAFDSPGKTELDLRPEIQS